MSAARSVVWEFELGVKLLAQICYLECKIRAVQAEHSRPGLT